MSKESYIRGFVKCAAAYGVDPNKLAQWKKMQETNHINLPKTPSPLDNTGNASENDASRPYNPPASGSQMPGAVQSIRDFLNNMNKSRKKIPLTPLPVPTRPIITPRKPAYQEEIERRLKEMPKVKLPRPWGMSLASHD